MPDTEVDQGILAGYVAIAVLTLLQQHRMDHDFVQQGFLHRTLAGVLD